MNRPIAVFDSGIGGLTVLQHVVDVLPNENYVYLADNEFFPYGIKSFEQLESRLRKVVKLLLSYNVKAIVVACNTASLHVETIKKIAIIPVIDVIAPTCNVVSQLTQNKKVCLLATDATVEQGVYQKKLGAWGIDVTAIACSNFVPIAENSINGGINVQKAVQNTLLPFLSMPFDTVILGCTHFGLIEKTIGNVLGKRQYVQCGLPTALYLQKVLCQSNLTVNVCNHCTGTVKFLTTESRQVFNNLSEMFPFDFSNVQVVRID